MTASEAATELLVDGEGPVRVWKLSRPARRNALSVGLLARLDEERERAVAEGCGVVVLSGDPAGGAFCAGFDLADLERLRVPDAPVPPDTPVHATFARLESAPFTLVTAVNGAAVGAGCELALLGDVRFARPGAAFMLPPVKLGIVYPHEGLERLRSALGSSLLRAMLTTARPVVSERLFAAGVIWSLDDDPLDAARAAALALAALSPEARLAHRDVLRTGP